MAQFLSVSVDLLKKHMSGRGKIRALELGAGCGIGAVALSLVLDSEDAHILATDKELRSLALVLENAIENNISDIGTKQLDFSSDDEVARVCQKPFDILLGASLQYDDGSLWPSGRLEEVLVNCMRRDKSSIAILAHRVGKLFPEPRCDASGFDHSCGGYVQQEVWHDRHVEITRIPGSTVQLYDYDRNGWASELEVVLVHFVSAF
jgi:hypothetical protein